MSKSYKGRASEIVMDGPAGIIPGVLANTLGADKPIGAIFSGLLDCVNAVADQAPHYFPFNAQIIAIGIRVRAQLGTGAAEVYVGTTADNDKFLLKSVPIAATAGTEYLFTAIDTDFLDAEIDKGDVVCFGSDGGATSTGSVDVTVLWVPRIGA